ncbi:CPBP family intramembrane glutamic endopeptidase [Streptococcus sanguinis]|jgi:membrane protease YdiL (CAAX protease family)|uniref:CPBP family intramembrane glutamic endopeptidase n=1 Tax=Streptococcus sanguinis TaxID=1305 RepID=UPI001374B9C9|nr:type II CAAX endopeptidase family protein [Streptococcus sanguinis]
MLAVKNCLYKKRKLSYTRKEKEEDMKAILKKLEYILLTLFVLFLSQIPFIFIRQMTASEKSFSAGQTIFVLVVYLLIIFFVLRIAKQEELLSLDFSFFKWSSLGWLAVSNVVMIGVNMLGAIIMLLEGQAISTANQDALNALFQHVPKILLVVGAVIQAPILEEVVFRGLIPQKIFTKHYVWGLVVGVILFGLFHSPTNIGSFVIYAGMGAVLATVAYIFKRLEMSILAHMLRNGVAVLIMILTGLVNK